MTTKNQAVKDERYNETTVDVPVIGGGTEKRSQWETRSRRGVKLGTEIPADVTPSGEIIEDAVGHRLYQNGFRIEAVSHIEAEGADWMSFDLGTIIRIKKSRIAALVWEDGGFGATVRTVKFWDHRQ